MQYYDKNGQPVRLMVDLVVKKTEQPKKKSAAAARNVNFQKETFG